MKHEVKQCKGCSYGRTPKDYDRCNYCGELFSVTENASVDVTSAGFNGLSVTDIDIEKFPKGMLDTKDTRLFLEVLKVESNQETCKIYQLKGSLESFYALISGSTFRTIHKFLKQCPHLSLFNIYTDLYVDEDLDRGEDVVPMGMFGVCFEKMVKDEIDTKEQER